MTTYDPNDPRRPRGSGASGWVIGLIVLIAIGIGIWWWGAWWGAGPRTATAPTRPAVTTTGAAPAPTTPAPAATPAKPAPPAGNTTSGH